MEPFQKIVHYLELQNPEKHKEIDKCKIFAIRIAYLSFDDQLVAVFEIYECTTKQ